jgi:PAS domain S-box-containing protein
MDDWRTAVSPPPSAYAARPESARRDAVVLVGLDGSIESWDEDAQAMFGWAPESVLGMPLWALFTDDSRDAVDALRRGATGAASAAATALDPDRVRIATEIATTRTIVVRDGAVGYMLIVRDVTEQQAIACALRACAGADDPASAVAAVRDSLSCWVPLSDLSLVKPRSERFRREGEPRELFGMLSAQFPEVRPATPRTRRLLAAVADAIGPALARSVELEEKSHALRRLRRSDRLQKEFLALITHDMRTPLAVIAGFATNLRDKWHDLPDAERLEELDAILRHSRSLTRIVEQDLQLALIDAGELPYELTSFDVAADIDRIVNEFACIGATRMSLSIEGPLPLVRADKQRNAQVLTNLLSNAVKYSPPEGVVSVRVFQRGPMVHVAVRDDGRGISEADARRLFRKFSRVGANGGSAVDGTGLGLYLSKRMVEAQSGRIWVESRPGDGATFTYTLPVTRSGAA